MSDGGWQTVVDWSYKLALTGFVGLNLAAGLAVVGNDLIKPAFAQDGVFLYGKINTANQMD